VDLGATQGLLQAGDDVRCPEVGCRLTRHDRVLEGQGLVRQAWRKVGIKSSSPVHPCRLEKG